ncbi:MAG: 3-dehydroquinate synthase [Candidatus Sumerlaeota bacterium]|nr:3-dehydroquinate synthase [Candidatus Sumerlaeota bacterium]
MSHVVRVGLGERSYEIHIGEGLIDRLGEEARPLLGKAPAAVVTAEPLAISLGERALAGLRAADVEARMFAVPDGESAKTLETVSRILDFLVEHRLPRQSVLFAVGGGVIGDMVGFAAAIYLRGIDYVQVPTTLLAMVDSSVGGKTAVNHSKGKNLIGAFHQPRLVAADLTALASLPRREYRAGLAEIIKHGVIRDAELFETLEERIEPLAAREARLLGPIIRRNCEIKAAVVESDEREAGPRAILNFGHTIGHAVESLASGSGMLHGEAISIGMVGAGRIAVAMSLWAPQECERLRALLERAGLPTRMPPLATEAVLARMGHDKKIVGRTLRFVLPEAIGRVVLRDDVPADLLANAIEELKG